MTINTPSRLDAIDLLRGVSAQLVLVNHMRAFYFVDYSDSSTRNPFTLAFYTLTGFGHQAVVIFFVVSGFLVGGAGWRTYKAKAWNPLSFSLRRLSRLWIVLIPALLLTHFLDTVGQTISPSLYRGELHSLFSSGPDLNFDFQGSRGLTTLLGNILFLQTIEVPVYGTNSPLWSLANEFWYYAIFILILTALSFNQHIIIRVASIISVILLLNYLPDDILILGLVWIAGVLVALGLHAGYIMRFSKIALLVASMTLLCSLFAARFDLFSSITPIGSDIVTGVATAIFVATFAQRANLPGWLARITFITAEYSYTLYLVHFPILMLIAAALFNGYQFELSPISLAIFMSIYFLINIFSYIFYLAFEARTLAVQRAIDKAIK